MKSSIKYLIFFLLCLMAVGKAQAQGTIVWEKKFPKPSSQALRTAVESPSKRFWVAVSARDAYPISTGTLSSFSAMAFDTLTGDTLWSRSFKEYYPIYSEGWGIAPAPYGHFWVVAKFFWTTTVPESEGIAVFRLDSLGNIVSHQEYMKNCNTIRPGGVYAMPDGGILMSGSLLWEENTCTEHDMFALRIDGNGNQVWKMIYTIPNMQLIHGSGLYPGNKLCMSYTNGNSALNNPNNVMFVDVNTGIILYEKQTPSGNERTDLQVFPLRDGTFIVAGTKIIDYNNSIGYGYLSHTDANFNILWEKIDTTVPRYGEIVKETVDGSFVTRGMPNMSMCPAFISKVDIATGNEIWRTCLYDSVQNIFRMQPNDICVTNNDVVYAVGQSGTLATSADFAIAKLTGVADFLQPSDYCSDSLRANFTGTWQQDTLRLRSTSNSGMAFQDSLDYQWFINGATVSLDSAVQQNLAAAQYPNGLPVTLVITNFWGCKDTLTAKVMPDGTVVGNRPVETGHAPSLRNAYPNPSAQHVSIGYTLPAKTENAVLRVYELGTGRTVAERNLSSNTQETRFDVSSWATGVYAYQLYVNGAPVAVKKMVVSR